MHALEELIIYYNNCKKDDLYREVIDKILVNLTKLENATIYEWADMCFASTTTISRLSRKLGYDSFSEFKSELIKSIENYSMLNQYVPVRERKNYGGSEEATYLGLVKKIIEDFEASADDKMFEQYADLLESHEDISIFTHGICFMEHHLQEDLIMGGHHVNLLTVAVSQYEEIKRLKSGTLVLFTCPFVQEKSIVCNMLEEIHRRGGILFLITDCSYLPYVKYADYVYSFDGYLNRVDDYWFSMFYSFLLMAYRRKYIEK